MKKKILNTILYILCAIAFIACLPYFPFLLLLFLYFLPSYVGRNHPNNTSILVINLFLGWTFVGWVVALAMAVSKH